MLQAIIKNEGFKLTQGMALRPEELFGEPSGEIHTARRDWASFTVIVYSREDVFLTVTDAAAFTPRAGCVWVRAAASCPGLGAASLQVAGMVDDDDGTHKADILLEGDSFTLPGRRAHQLRLAVDVPADAAPGRYEGTVRFYERVLFGEETEALSLGFAVTVHDVLLPGIRERKFHLDLWQHVANIARKHEVKLFSDAHFRILEGYVESLAALGQKAVTVVASEIPWSGQRCFNDREYMSDLFEYSMIRVEKCESGGFAYDYSAMERYVEMCFSHGVDREIEIFGLCNIWMDEAKGWGKAAPDWPDGVRVRYLDEASGTYLYMREYDEIAGYVAALQDFLERKGWLGRALVVADKPGDMAQYRRSLEALRRAAPKLRFKTAINHAEFIAEFRDIVADYVPVLPAVSGEWDALCKARSMISGRLLYYVCCWPPYPNTFIRSPLCESRLLPLLAAWLGLDGFLRWNYTVWPEAPRERIVYRPGEWPAGDTCFVYPSRGGAPLLSLRYFALKRGVEDYELARMAAELPGGGEALGRVWDLLVRRGDIREWEYREGLDPSALYSPDWRDYETARLILLKALEQKHHM
jgi:hypothetical protein